MKYLRAGSESLCLTQTVQDGPLYTSLRVLIDL